MPVNNILQPDTWASSTGLGAYPERSYYYDAFSPDFSFYWGTTKFGSEVKELCFYRTLTCFYREAMDDVEDRRRLLFYYLRHEFSSENADDAVMRLAHQLPIDSFVPKALNNLCLAYKQPPTRMWGAGDDADAYSEDFAAVYEEMNFDREAQDLYRLAKLCNVVKVRPWVHTATGAMKLQVLTPDLYRVATDEDGEEIELWHQTEHNGEAAHRVWTLTETYIADNEGKPVRGTEQQNHYGRIPYATLRMQSLVPGDPYGGGMFSLVEANLVANKKEFAAAVGMTMNAFGVWVAINAEMTEGGGAITPDKLIIADGVKGDDNSFIPPHVEHVVGNAMFGAVREDKRQGMKDALRSAGLPSSLIEENVGTPPSGVARVMERQELLEQRDADKLTLAVFERDFADLVALVTNKDGYEIPLPEEFDFQVDYAEERIYQEPAVEYAYIREKAKNGDISLVEYAALVMGIDEPDEERVVELIAERRELWKTAQGSPTPPGAPPPPPNGEAPTDGKPTPGDDAAPDAAPSPADMPMNGADNSNPFEN
jgi:hypothetical protein